MSAPNRKRFWNSISAPSAKSRPAPAPRPAAPLLSAKTGTHCEHASMFEQGATLMTREIDRRKTGKAMRRIARAKAAAERAIREGDLD